jgi:pimeloyl-ACP methyl ester carboxylesterase
LQSSAVNTENFFITAENNQKIWCELEAPISLAEGEKTPLLVLINGYQRDSSDFRAFRKRLRVQIPSVSFLAIDNRGCGKSSILPENSNFSFSVQTMSNDSIVCIQSALKILSLKENHNQINFKQVKLYLLGISMGGMICQKIASEMNNCEGLILVSTTAGGEARVWPTNKLASKNRTEFQPWPSTLEGMKTRMEKYFGSRYLKTHSFVVEKMCESLFKKYNMTQAQKNISQDSDTENINSMRQFEASANFDGTNSLGRIHCKTIIFTGSEDKIIPKENSYLLNSQIKNSSVVEYPEVGHLILAEEPEKFVFQVKQFLQETL